MGSLTKKQRKDLTRIIISLIIFTALMVAEHTGLIPHAHSGAPAVIIAYLIPYFLVGYDVIRKCFLGIAHGQWFDECFLMTLATVGAFGCGAFKNPPEVVAEAYNEVIRDYLYDFETIEFAIVCSDGKPSWNYEVFSKTIK